MNATDSILFVPHGGGPLPLLGHEPHRELTAFLKSAAQNLIQPNVIIVVTAHWEAAAIQVSTASSPAMLFDYYGFPEETYHYNYPALGAPDIANEIVVALNNAGISANADSERGFDHGTFVPLMLMYPEANVPVIQMSLQHSLDPKTHIDVGEVLASFVEQGALLIGSGLSFHNVQAQMSQLEQNNNTVTPQSKAFDDWLNETVGLNLEQAEEQLVNWTSAPHARYCHPREEHLLPLHVCFGAAKALKRNLRSVYSDGLMGASVSAFAA